LKVSSTHHDRIRTAKDDVREPYEEEGSGKMYRVKDGVVSSILSPNLMRELKH